MSHNQSSPKIIFTILYLMGLLIYMLKSLVGVSFPYLKSQFGFSHLQLGQIASIYFWAYSLSFLILGLLTRKIGVRRHAILTYVGMGGCEILMSLANTFQSFFWIKAIEGVVSAGFFICSATLVSALFSPERKKQVQSYQISSIGLASIIISLILVPLMSNYSWRIGYFANGLLALLIAGLIFYKIPNINLESSTARQVSYWQILRRKVTLLLMCNLFFINVYLYAILNFAVLYFVEEKHYSTQMASNFAALNALSAFGLILFCGFLSKFLRLKTIYLLVLILICAFSLGIVYSQYYVACMALGYGMSLAGFSMLMAFSQQVYSKSEIPIACGIVNFGGAVGGAIAPTFFGYILQTTHSYNLCFQILAGIVLLSFITTLPLSERN